MERDEITIDASCGGGQIVRTSFALATILQRGRGSQHRAESAAEED